MNKKNLFENIVAGLLTTFILWLGGQIFSSGNVSHQDIERAILIETNTDLESSTKPNSDSLSLEEVISAVKKDRFERSYRAKQLKLVMENIQVMDPFLVFSIVSIKHIFGGLIFGLLNLIIIGYAAQGTLNHPSGGGCYTMFASPLLTMLILFMSMLVLYGLHYVNILSPLTYWLILGVNVWITLFGFIILYSRVQSKVLSGCFGSIIMFTIFTPCYLEIAPNILMYGLSLAMT